MHLAHIDFIGFCHHAKVELAVDGLLLIRPNVDMGFNADSAQSSFVASISLFGYTPNCIQHSPFGFA